MDGDNVSQNQPFQLVNLIFTSSTRVFFVLTEPILLINSIISFTIDDWYISCD